MSAENVMSIGPITWEPLTTEEQDEICGLFLDFREFKIPVRVNPEGWVLPQPYLKVAQTIYNFKFNPSDVVVMTFPKCGTMWMLELVWTMRHNPNLDNPEALKVITDRCDQIEYDMFFNTPSYFPNLLQKFKELFPEKDPEKGIFAPMAEIEKTKKVLKTHLAFSSFNPENLNRCKVVYVARNAKDAALSSYNFSRLLKVMDYVGNLEQFVTFFMENKLLHCPYWNHVKEAWDRKDHPNVHFVFFEDLKTNPEKEVRRLDRFLETDLNDQQIKNVVTYTNFENMKKRDNQFRKGEGLYQYLMNTELMEKEGGFYRKGRVGSWREAQLSTEVEEKFSNWISENEKSTGIKFQYE